MSACEAEGDAEGEGRAELIRSKRSSVSSWSWSRRARGCPNLGGGEGGKGENG